MSTILTQLHLLLMLWSLMANGTIRFANYYEDHMVLQRAPQRAIVWGYADTFNTLITLTMNNKIYHTLSYSSSNDAANLSIWAITLDAQTEEGPFQVNASHKLANGSIETIGLYDVLFGDVWLCSGQSNMRVPLVGMFNASSEIENAGKYPKIRLLNIQSAKASTPQEEVLTIALNWTLASPTSAKNLWTSAVCWVYGRMIHQGLGERPIGLIHASVSGTDIELWSPPEALEQCGIKQTSDIMLKVDPASDDEVNADADHNSDLYNAMIHPFTRMVLKGVIWYQGENNAKHNCDKYNCTFPKMIEAWRAIWHTRTNFSSDPLFPFGFVQLSTNDPTGTVIGGFPWIRWHQTFDVGYVPNNVVPNVFMAVALDLRDDAMRVHPRDKIDVGYRLSRSGLAVAYGFKNITYQGPIIANLSVVSDSRKINVTYSRTVSTNIELRNSNGFEVCCQGQEICRSNETSWVATPASRIPDIPLTISLDVPNSCVSKQINGLRYLWKETPCLFKEAAVYSAEDSNLPAPPYIHFF